LVSVNCHALGDVPEFVKTGVQFAGTARLVVAQIRDVTLAKVWQFNITFPLADTVMLEIRGPPKTVSEATALVTLPQALLTITE
jgi:hypothetical protein